ncbi:ATP-NAD kinase-like domain-containing protein, partial [Cokeromyces recurvatus]|uniref:ATP-NAD kinase-like domain-containing protein n=1 Tax=Cokeromyces recurvatus TaxID=90255 RepID=UPI00221E58EA
MHKMNNSLNKQGQDFISNNTSSTEPTNWIKQTNNSNISKRPSIQHSRINNSVELDNTSSEGRPSIYLFIFVNPVSGDKKGADLVALPIQHFRLRRFPQVQVEIHDILNDEDRNNGIKNIQLVECKLKFNQIPPIEQNEVDINNDENPTLSKGVQTRQIHVWSAGGDGTVMSVFELLVAHKIDLGLVFFSCIPFGTGNDFSQVLGWGRTIPDKNILGSKLQNLEELICDRLEKSEVARLDVWEIKLTSYPSGYVREAGPKERNDGHDVAEVKNGHLKHEDELPLEKEETVLVRKMSNYMSIGVQGFVGSGFEAHRAGNRFANKLVYAHESSKWVFWRRFPHLSHYIQNISQNGQKTLEWPNPEEKQKESSKISNNNNIPHMMNDPIDLVIQNIPHIWGREVDLWGEAQSGLEAVSNRSGPTDPRNWKPQRANDCRLEIMSIENMSSYLKKLANIRHHVSRIGQFDSPFEINFHQPEYHLKKTDKLEESSSAWSKTKAFVKDKSRHKYEKKNIMCIMC